MLLKFIGKGLTIKKFTPWIRRKVCGICNAIAVAFDMGRSVCLRFILSAECQPFIFCKMRLGVAQGWTSLPRQLDRESHWREAAALFV